MNSNVMIDWRFVVALGAATAGIILATKMDSAAAERVLTVAVDTYKRMEIAQYGDC